MSFAKKLFIVYALGFLIGVSGCVSYPRYECKPDMNSFSEGVFLKTICEPIK